MVYHEKLRHSGVIISIQGQDKVKVESDRTFNLRSPSVVIHSSGNELKVSAVKYCQIKVLLQDPSVAASKNEWQICHIPFEMERLMKRGSNEGKKGNRKSKAAQVGCYFLLHVKTQQAVSGETPDC